MTRPARPKIYHIVHIDKLPSILADACLSSDADMRKRPPAGTVIGMNAIKDRRLRLPVKCWPGDFVGEYVPFYFCSRSTMLYVIHMANNPELEYRGGQSPIVHLEADLMNVLDWARDNEVRWSISLSNAGAYYAEFGNEIGALDQLNWTAIAATDFRRPEIKEGKQAEFLVKGMFPWFLFDRVGVISPAMAQRVADLIRDEEFRPPIEIKRDWYY